MAKQGTDPRVAASEQNVAVHGAVQQALADMGVHDADDLGPGRADIGMIAQRLNEMPVELDPDAMDEAQRDAEWEKSVESPEQPYQPRPSAPSAAAPETPATQQSEDRLTQLQQQMEQIAIERDDLKDKLTRTNRSVRKLRDLEAEVQQLRSVPPAYPQVYPAYASPQQVGIDPQQPMTAADVWQLMMSQSQAFGNRINEAIKQAVTTSRAIQGYSLTSEQEEDLLDGNPWLERLPVGEREQAMMALSRQTTSSPSTPAPSRVSQVPTLTPRPVDMTALARAKHLTATTFIEPSSRTSTQEQAAATGVDSALSKKIAEWKEAKAARPGQPGFEAGQYGENIKVERLIKEINALQRRRI